LGDCWRRERRESTITGDWLVSWSARLVRVRRGGLPF